MSAVITPFEGTELFNTASFNNRISQINTGFSYVSNPNLLDNWYFGNSVNQRGQTSYTGPVYGIDRWAGNRDQTITIADNYLNIAKGNDIASGFSQFFLREAIPTGATVTLSFLFAPGTQNCVFGLRETNKWSWFAQAVVQTDETNYQLVSVTIPDVTLSTGNFVVWLSFETENPGSVIRTIAAKLELGSTQTLAHREGDKWVLNEVPDYGEQLRRCQRYFVRLGFADSYCTIGLGLARDGTYISTPLTVPEDLRTLPAVTISGQITMRHSEKVATGSSTVYVDANGVGSVLLKIQASGFTAGDLWEAFLAPGNYISISADL